MSAEIVKSEFVSVENETIPGLSEAIAFGSHEPEEAVGGAEANLPKDAVDHWPVEQKIHAFYIVKYRTFDDPKIKAKLDAAEKDVRNKIQARSQILDKLQAIRSKRYQISEQIKPLSEENNKFKSIMDGQKKEMEPLNQALSQLRTNNPNRERGTAICSSEAELNKLIKSYNYRIQHESIPLTEEKQILREIKQLEGTREKVIANAANRAKIEESLGGKQTLQDQVNLIGDGFSGHKKERQVIAAKIKQLIEERSAIDKDIEKLQEELKAATEKRDQARDTVKGLYKQLDDGNDCFYQNRALLNKARTIANSKDIAALKDFSSSETDKFMKMWNEKKPFRDDYEKRILLSLDNRQLSRDGRMRNPDEKPLTVPEPLKPKLQTVEPLKPKLQTVEPLKPKLQTVELEKTQKEPKSKQDKEVKSSKPIEAVDLSEDSEKVKEIEKPKKVENKVDEAKLKEVKREQEIAKAKQALERKKKLAEKAATKAAVKAQKEAEKKEKDRERKLKKKAGVVEEQLTETEAEAIAEPVETEETTEEHVVPKSKGRKESVMRNRTRSKGPDSISKAILKRKKSTNYYWVWAAPAAVSVMMVFVIGYKYLI